MTKDMTKGSPIRLILMFTLPLLVGNIFQQFYSLADTLIVGRTIGVHALAAVGSTGSINFLIMGFVNGASMGLAVLSAQRFGAKDMKGLRRSFATGILISAAITVVVTSLSVPLTWKILRLLRTPKEIISGAHDYIVVIFAGTLANMLFNYLSNIIRSMGDSRTPLLFLIVACVLNIILDYTFILAFHTGVVGAAVATVFSQLVSGICCVIYIRRKLPFLWPKRVDFEIDADEVGQHLKIAVPMGFQQSIIAIGSVMIQFVLNGLGSISVAAFTAASKIDQIATQPMSSFGSAMGTYTAQNYGAGKPERIKKGVRQCLMVSISFSIVAGAVNILFGHRLAGLFVSPMVQKVVTLAHTYLTITGSTYCFLAALFIIRFTLQGLGDSVIPTFAGIVELIMRFIAALLLAKLFGFAGVCMASPLAWIGACALLTAAYIYKTRHVLKSTPAAGQ